MVAQLVPDTAQLDFKFEGTPGNDADGSQAQFSFYVRDEVDPWDQEALDALALYGEQWFNAGKNAGLSGKSLMSGIYALKHIVARDLSQVAGGVSDRVVDIQGTKGGDAVASSEAALVRFAMTPGGFPRRGHIFWPGLTVADVTTNNLAAGVAAQIAQTVLDFIGDINDITQGGRVSWAVVRVSRSLQTNDDVKEAREALRAAIAAAKRASGLTNTVAGVSVRSLVASQRDRRPGE